MTWQQTIDDEKEDAYEEGLEAGRAEGLSAGLTQGASRKAIEAAENLLREGDSVEKVFRCIGLTMEQVQEIAEKIAVKVEI